MRRGAETHKAMEEGQDVIENEDKEGLVVPVSDAVVDPYAMVVLHGSTEQQCGLKDARAEGATCIEAFCEDASIGSDAWHNGACRPWQRRRKAIKESRKGFEG